MNHLFRAPFLLLFFFFVTACATTKKDFRVSDVQEGERVIFGRVKISQSGLDITENCFVFFEGASSYRLDKTGLVYHRISTESPGIIEFRCKDISIYRFKFAKKIVIPLGKQKDMASYFGDIVVDWDFNGGLKVFAMFDSGNDGHLTYRAEDKFKDTSPGFHKLHGKSANMKYVKTLVLPASQ